jgi:hypothetical protein
MSLTYRLDSPAALLRKLEREFYRAFHAPTPLAKSDHFFNFCVTASSMRDYCLEYLGATTPSQQEPHHDLWRAQPLLVAATEIANSAKHFVLRERRSGAPKPVKTRTVRLKKTRFLNVYRNDKGDMHLVEAERAEVSVTLSDGTRLELHAFANALLEYWSYYLRSIGISVRRQPHARLSSSAA